MSDPRAAAELDALAIIVGELIVAHCQSQKQLFEFAERVAAITSTSNPGAHAGGNAGERAMWAAAIGERAFASARAKLGIR